MMQRLVVELHPDSMNKLKRIAVTMLLILNAHHVLACLIFFYHDHNQVLVANHEDWFAGNSAIKFRARNVSRYASITFTFLDEGNPQGGMNEAGLFFDAAHTPHQIENPTGKKEATFNIWQYLLDHAANVDEALIILERYQVKDFQEATVVLADKSGAAVIVGLHNNRIDIRKQVGNYLLQTNYNQWQPELSEEKVCTRFETVEKKLANHPPVTVETMTDVLKQTHQGGLTVYSNIYDLKNSRIITFNKRNFDKPIVTTFPSNNDYGECIIGLDALERDSTLAPTCTDNATPIVVRGRIVDASTHAPLPYANIGIPGKNIGTLSDPDGTFELRTPSGVLGDTLHFSVVTHESQRLILNRTLKDSFLIIPLKEQPTLLPAVTIESTRIKSKIARLGWMGGKDGVLPLDTMQGGGAVAMLLEAESAPVYFDKLQVRLMYNSKDTVKFRFHVYAYDSATDAPGPELLRKEIILSENKRFGWLRFDMANYDITIPVMKFFIGFEWIEELADRRKMITGLRAFEKWKADELRKGNPKIVELTDEQGNKTGELKYHGNMMDWPGFTDLPPFAGLMVESGKSSETRAYRTFERKTSFGDWTELKSTLNVVLTVRH